MIRYDLKCDADHSFDSWFQSADAFDTLLKAGHVTCATCGSAKVTKTLMAPSVKTARKTEGALSTPESEMEQKLSELRNHVEENSDYVGLNFAAEARKMHDGEEPHRAIYGEAKFEDAKSLIEDGVPVAPLPFRPKQKAN